jgi:hypothetical protein
MVRNDWNPRPLRPLSPLEGDSEDGTEDGWERRFWDEHRRDTHNGDRQHVMSRDRHQKKEFVWPRDKGSPGRWNRFKDVCKGKGPDVFVRNQGSRGPHRSEWSGWQEERHLPCHPNVETLIDNRGFPFQRQEILQHWWAHRSPDKPYDFQSRKHRSPRHNHWQDVERDRHNNEEIYTMRADGRKWVSEDVDGGLYNHRRGPDPFRIHHMHDPGFFLAGARQCDSCWAHMN